LQAESHLKRATPLFALPLQSDSLTQSNIGSTSALPILHQNRDVVLLHFPSMEIDNLFEKLLTFTTSSEINSNQPTLWNPNVSPLSFMGPECFERTGKDIWCRGIEVSSPGLDKEMITYVEMNANDYAKYNDQTFAITPRPFRMGMCGGSVNLSGSSLCAGLIEGIVPENLPTLPEQSLSLLSILEQGNKNAEDITNNMRKCMCYVNSTLLQSMMEMYEKENTHN
jgi:hypothetical protein